jgi:hypothetical protein
MLLHISISTDNLIGVDDDAVVVVVIVGTHLAETWGERNSDLMDFDCWEDMV